jgi:hypothetical protein
MIGCLVDWLTSAYGAFSGGVPVPSLSGEQKTWLLLAGLAVEALANRPVLFAPE